MATRTVVLPGLAGALQVLPVGIDRGIAGRRGFLVRRVIVCGPLVLERGLAEGPVLEQEVRELVVDGRRLRVLRERRQELAVPAQGLDVVRRLLGGELRVLVQGVVVSREVAEVALQVAEHLGRRGYVEVAPVIRLQSVGRREFFLGFQHELGELALGEDLDHAHAEMGRRAVIRVLRHEQAVGLGRVVVTKLSEVELAQVRVDAVFVVAAPVFREVLAHDVGPAEVGEAEAYDPERVRDPPLFVFRVLLLEVVARGNLVIEQRHEPMLRLVVEILLVERPAELVERELVVRGVGTEPDDRRVGRFGLAEFPAREVELATPVLHLVVVSRMRIRGDEALHRLHGFFGPPQLVVRARLLVQHLVVVLVGRILGEQPVVQRDGLERGGRVRRLRTGRRRQARRRGRARFELLLGLGGRAARSRCRECRAFGVRGDRGALRSLHLDDPPVAIDPELLLDLQVGKPAHGLGSQLRLGRLVEEAAVALHGLLEPFGHGDFRRVGLDRVQLGERALLRARGTACRQRSRHCERECGPAAHFPASAGCDARARS